jgi:hypothetical protein
MAAASERAGCATSAFSGKINWVQIDLGKDNHDHLISAEERLSLAIARE